MGSQFYNDSSGVPAILLGLVIIIMLGVGVIVLTDGTSSPPEPVEPIAGKDNIARIAELTTELGRLRKQEDQQKKFDALVEELGEQKRILTLQREAVTLLQGEAGIIRQSLATTKDAFATYRNKVRSNLWDAGVGKEYTELRALNGKTYRKVTIRGISTLEMKISYEGGFGTVSVLDLPAQIVDEFQLDKSEVREILNARKEAQQAQLAKRKEVAKRKAEEQLLADKEREGKKSRGPSKEEREASQMEIAKTRVAVAKLEASLQLLNVQLAEARRKTSGSQRSPPGSLETWGQRANRLANLVARATTQLSVMESRLRSLEAAAKR